MDEWRKLRQEQDLAYEESLEVDRKKVATAHYIGETKHVCVPGGSSQRGGEKGRTAE